MRSKDFMERGYIMTREELKKHCQKQIENCEMRERYLQKRFGTTGEEQPHGNVYEEHKLILELLEQEPCEDAVSRQAVLDGVDRYIYKSQSTGTQDDFYSFAELVVKALPPVTPKPRTGKWIPTQHFDEWYCPTGVCSNCGIEYIYGLPFCPACGAKMEGESE